MRNKSTLSLMEQICMLLIFAFASVLCLQAFVWSHNQSMQNSATDKALIETQNVAELVRHKNGDLQAAAAIYGGDCDGFSWQISFDKDWNQTFDDWQYTLQVIKQDAGQPLLGSAVISVLQRDGCELSVVTLNYQEVSHHE